MSTSFDAAATITAMILERLETGTAPWVRPWTGQPISRPLRQCGTPYRGINTLILWLMAERHGYDSPYWFTYQQAAKFGAQVRKGQKASHAVFYKQLGDTDGDHQGAADEPSSVNLWRRVLRSYAIFNADQIDNLPVRYLPQDPSPPLPASELRAKIEAFFDRLPAIVEHHGASAYYTPSTDIITLPPIDRFHDFPSYASVRGHETAHWTGSSKRLARDFSGRFGSAAYAFEELVACVTQSMLCARLGLPDTLMDNHASYIASWIKVLKGDKTAIMTAAARAEEACDYIYARSDPDLVHDLSLSDERTSLAA